MKTYYFNGGIDEENTNKCIEFLNQNEDVTLYLTSSGGENYCTEVLLDVINKRCKEIIGVGYLMSNAFKLFYSVEIKKELKPYTFGMFHLSGSEYRLGENGKMMIKDQKFELKQLQREFPATIEFCKKLGMTKKEIQTIKKGEDQYFAYERLKELC